MLLQSTENGICRENMVLPLVFVYIVGDYTPITALLIFAATRDNPLQSFEDLPSKINILGK